jgi:hypothetical protein
LVRAIAWQREMAKNAELSLRGLARKVGLSPPMITYHLRLLKLDPDIQKYLRGLQTASAMEHFSLRKMMELAKLPITGQRVAFASLQREFEKRPALGAAVEPKALRSRGGISL